VRDIERTRTCGRGRSSVIRCLFDCANTSPSRNQVVTSHTIRSPGGVVTARSTREAGTGWRRYGGARCQGYRVRLHPRPVRRHPNCPRCRCRRRWARTKSAAASRSFIRGRSASTTYRLSCHRRRPARRRMTASLRPIGDGRGPRWPRGHHDSVRGQGVHQRAASGPASPASSATWSRSSGPGRRSGHRVEVAYAVDG
jgi:hypothetical protein